MIEAIKELVQLMNSVHDSLIKIFALLGFGFDDKQMHFLVIGVIGIVLFFITNAVFKFLAKYSITTISFIYTFTVMLVLVFGIEIEQKITHRGNLEFEDIIAGLWGFIEFFGIYVLIKLIVMGIKHLLHLTKEDNKEEI